MGLLETLLLALLICLLGKLVRNVTGAYERARAAVRGREPPRAWGPQVELGLWAASSAVALVNGGFPYSAAEVMGLGLVAVGASWLLAAAVGLLTLRLSPRRS